VWSLAGGYARLLSRRDAAAISDFGKAIELAAAYKNADHNRSVVRKLASDSRGAGADAAIASMLVE
jgi:hypothetical protein